VVFVLCFFLFRRSLTRLFSQLRPGQRVLGRLLTGTSTKLAVGSFSQARKELTFSTSATILIAACGVRLRKREIMMLTPGLCHGILRSRQPGLLEGFCDQKQQADSSQAYCLYLGYLWFCTKILKRLYSII
jgi:hypothetical protein